MERACFIEEWKMRVLQNAVGVVGEALEKCLIVRRSQFYVVSN
jgi:hypothetical protein